MNSGLLLLVLIGIWLAFLLPIWLKRNSSPHMASADNFSKAIATLRDNRPQVDASGTRIQTQSRTAPKAGSRMSAKRRRLAARRRAFGASLMMFPTAILLQLITGSLLVWLLPVAGLALAVAYARHSVKLDRVNQIRTSSNPSRSLLSGLGAAGRAAAERLLQTERMFETENTPAWQSAGTDFGSAWQAPEPVLPQPVNGDRWSSEEMLEAASAQRARARAELIADLLKEENQKLVIDDQPTGEITRIVGA
jgi:hypothetical protein